MLVAFATHSGQHSRPSRPNTHAGAYTAFFQPNRGQAPPENDTLTFSRHAFSCIFSEAVGSSKSESAPRSPVEAGPTFRLQAAPVGPACAHARQFRWSASLRLWGGGAGHTYVDPQHELPQPVRPCEYQARLSDHLLHRLWLAAQKRLLPRRLVRQPHIQLEQRIQELLSRLSRAGGQPPAEEGNALPLCCSLAPQMANALGKAHSPRQPGVKVPAVCRDRLLSAAGAAGAPAPVAALPQRARGSAQNRLSTHRLQAYQ